DEVLIAARDRIRGRKVPLGSHRVNETRERIRDLEVCILHSAHGVLNILDPLRLHSSVDGAADRLEELHLTIGWVDAAKGASASGTSRSRTGVERGPQAVPGKIRDQRPGSDRARWVSAGRTAEREIRIGDGYAGLGWAEVACRADLVDIDAEQSMGLDVAEEISADNHALTDFMLDSNVHLHGTGRPVVGGE